MLFSLREDREEGVVLRTRPQPLSTRAPRLPPQHPLGTLQPLLRPCTRLRRHPASPSLLRLLMLLPLSGLPLPFPTFLSSRLQAGHTSCGEPRGQPWPDAGARVPHAEAAASACKPRAGTAGQAIVPRPAMVSGRFRPFPLVPAGKMDQNRIELESRLEQGSWEPVWQAPLPPLGSVGTVLSQCPHTHSSRAARLRPGVPRARCSSPPLGRTGPPAAAPPRRVRMRTFTE